MKVFGAWFLCFVLLVAGLSVGLELVSTLQAQRVLLVVDNTFSLQAKADAVRAAVDALTHSRYDTFQLADKAALLTTDWTHSLPVSKLQYLGPHDSEDLQSRVGEWRRKLVPPPTQILIFSDTDETVPFTEVRKF